MTGTETVSMEQHNTKWDADQAEAIRLCCDTDKRIVGVTGLAGTGKTSLFVEAYNALTAAGYSVVATAPTGKAAKRIKEATGIEAITMHRLLEYSHPGEPDPKTGKPRGVSIPKRDKQNPVPYDIVLADEYGMVNHELHRNMMDALQGGRRIRCFGDVNQLKPIEENKKLEGQPTPFELILEKFPSKVLDKIYRQGDGSGIVVNGAKIVKGYMPMRYPDFQLSITEKPVEVLEDFVLQSLDNGVSFASIENQIITLQHSSWVGTVKLNHILQMLLNPEMPHQTELDRHQWDKREHISVAVSDKIIYVQNNYDLGIFNGELGVIKDITTWGEIVVDLGDREMCIPPAMEVTNRYGNQVTIDPRRDIELAYAITTHKMQGSEAENVVYMLNKSTSFMQKRSNFYTGVTRARKHVNVISDMRSLANSVNKR
jgi:exodeoxyribonuclease V alpha subunit